MFCGKERVTAPVEAEAVTWLVVPVREVTPVLVIVTAPVAAETEIPVPLAREVTPALLNVMVPPSATVPPPDRPVPAVTVTEELTKSALATLASTIEAELTEAVVIRPEVSTANRLVLAALFWAWIKYPAEAVSVFRFMWSAYEELRLPFSVRLIPVVVELPRPVTVANVEVSLTVTLPVAPDTEISVPATSDKTPVLLMVTAPVAPDTLIPLPATLEVTPVLAIVIVPLPLLVVETPVPAANVNVPPWLIVELLPVVAAAVKSEPPDTKQVAQPMSPAAERVIGAEAETATVPEAFGKVMVLLLVAGVQVKVPVVPLVPVKTS